MDDGALDLTDWLVSLRERLALVDRTFRAAPNMVERQVSVYAGLVALLDHVRNLPALKQHLAALEALAHALDELVIGRSPALLAKQNKNAGGRELSTREESTKSKAVAFVEILILSGWAEKDASKMVAGWLAEAGVVGTRGKRPLSQATVRWWRTDAASGDHPALRSAADSTIADLRDASPVWPLPKAVAAFVLGQVGRTPTFMT